MVRAVSGEGLAVGAVSGEGLAVSAKRLEHSEKRAASPLITRCRAAYWRFTANRSPLTQPKQNPVKVWTAPASGWNETNIWAPELHHIGPHWYIYYAGGQRHPNGQDAPFTTQHAGVLESDADDPQGAYTDRGMLYTGDDVAGTSNNVWAIDLTVHTINGQQYAVWSGWDQNNPTTDKIPQNLYIARMSSPMLSARMVPLSVESCVIWSMWLA